MTCSTFGARRLVPQKWFGEVEVEIVMGVPREENECKGVIIIIIIKLDLYSAFYKAQKRFTHIKT